MFDKLQRKFIKIISLAILIVNIFLCVIALGTNYLSIKNNEIEIIQEIYKNEGKEYALMDLFMSNPLKVFSVDSLLEKIWGYEDVDIAVIWVHISNIRKKLKSIDSKVSISISRGLGYFLEHKDV